MRKIISIVLAVILTFSLAGCGISSGKADVSVKQGEMLLTGKVTKVSGNLLTLETDKSNISDKFYIGYTDEIVVVQEDAYVVDYTADVFKGKTISVICSELVEETYPAGLTQVRMIIIK
ncbi:MAG: hypothetical protein IJW86_05360 [Clostridia bacterium]|nr:hypothetical protein [Clostridia bacterium]